MSAAYFNQCSVRGGRSNCAQYAAVLISFFHSLKHFVRFFLSVIVCWTAARVFSCQVLLCVLLFVPSVTPCFLLAKMVPDRILSVNASIDTIGEILLKIIPTLEEVSQRVNYLVNFVYMRPVWDD